MSEFKGKTHRETCQSCNGSGMISCIYPKKDRKCRNCGGLSFEVLQTDNYETAARCNKCGMYYLVHCG